MMLISLRCRFRTAVSTDSDGDPCVNQRPMRENISRAPRTQASRSRVVPAKVRRGEQLLVAKVQNYESADQDRIRLGISMRCI